MGFASSYLSKHRLYGDFIDSPPDTDLGFIVVIPCYDEGGLIGALESLYQADRPGRSVEVLVAVNQPAGAPAHITHRNRQTLREVEAWRASNLDPDEPFRVHAFYIADLPPEKAGAGLARKVGMDEALARLNRLDRPGGWIISLDADTRVDRHYFTEMEKALHRDPKLNAAVLYFEHPLDEVTWGKDIREGIIRYELFLRYYNQALRWSGYPYAFQTIGSAFAVRAEAYAKQGGMTTKRAGEDFYFLNKVFQLEHVQDVTSTAVYPSPRFSERVLFGTGPEMLRWSQNREQGRQTYLTYDPEVFACLKRFIARVDAFYKATPARRDELLGEQDAVMQDFLGQVHFARELTRINNNCNSLRAFRKHFFHWFNGLRIIRFIHVAHEREHSKIPLHQAATTLLRWMNLEAPADVPGPTGYPGLANDSEPPDNPDQTGYPGQANGSGQADHSRQAGDPRQTDRSQQSNGSGQSDTPQQADGSQQSGYPQLSGYPGQNGYPVQTGYPGLLEKYRHLERNHPHHIKG